MTQNQNAIQAALSAENFPRTRLKPAGWGMMNCFPLWGLILSTCPRKESLEEDHPISIY